MARLIYGLNPSLDGYAGHEQLGPPDPALLRRFIEDVRGPMGMLYGRRMYEVMRFRDDHRPERGAGEYAEAWRNKLDAADRHHD